MADITLQAETPLKAYTNIFGNTRLYERQNLSMYSIAVGMEQKAAQASISKQLGVDWPTVGTSMVNADADCRLLGLQSDQVWVVLDKPASSHGQAVPLPTLPQTAYVTDQSDSWAALALQGKNARQALERICPIDLHPAVFAIDQVTRTSMEHLAVIILRESDDGYLLLSPRSSAQSFLHAVVTSLHNTA